MKFTGRFIFAFILAVAATALNYAWMVGKAPPTAGYVAVNQRITQGEVIEGNMLVELQLPVGHAYTETFLPWRARHSLIGLRAVRSFQNRELVQQSDVAAVDVLPDYDILGPFRLLAVGGQFANADDDESQSSGSSAITIAIPFGAGDAGRIDEKTRRLVQIVEQERTRRSGTDESSDLRLVGIVAWQAATTDQPVASPVADPTNMPRRGLGLNEGELALVVPLPNLDTIPEVLLREDSPQIGFLVPATVVRSLDRVRTPSDVLDDWDDW